MSLTAAAAPAPAAASAAAWGRPLTLAPTSSPWRFFIGARERPLVDRPHYVRGYVGDEAAGRASTVSLVSEGDKIPPGEKQTRFCSRHAHVPVRTECIRGEGVLIIMHGRSRLTIEGRGGGVLGVMHGRSRTNMDPRIPTMPGRSNSGFTEQVDIFLHQARSAERYWASRVKGELHPAEDRLSGGFSCMGTTASVHCSREGGFTLRV